MKIFNTKITIHTFLFKFSTQRPSLKFKPQSPYNKHSYFILKNNHVRCKNQSELSIDAASHWFGSAMSAATRDTDSVGDSAACLGYGIIFGIILVVSGCR